MVDQGSRGYWTAVVLTDPIRVRCFAGTKAEAERDCEEWLNQLRYYGSAWSLMFGLIDVVVDRRVTVEREEDDETESL